MRLILFIIASSLMLGCVKRTISISSNPPGALVWVNDREVGRTPVSFNFTYHGEYDIRIEGEGSEPIMTTAWTDRPFWDAPFVDLAAEVAPINIDTKTVWHFELDPLKNNPEELLQRAKKLRTYTQGVDRE
ncbi:MAG TPA: PEGA domain-containing protein [Phycisphaerales bacterium]|nr:PEGA domain-containing protein [Phycisphaerales bacterium]HIB51373.1 PEGA domain-containing protein [Phycisphaerales bacterium]HIO20040.1 PEGA domain-containing protein [Phycisphaerales bacterium]HIO52486.1 PEGA domain-containing protein [Phycisphaerales bacterium]